MSTALHRVVRGSGMKVLFQQQLCCPLCGNGYSVSIQEPWHSTWYGHCEQCKFGCHFTALCDRQSGSIEIVAEDDNDFRLSDMEW